MLDPLLLEEVLELLLLALPELEELLLLVFPELEAGWLASLLLLLLLQEMTRAASVAAPATNADFGDKAYFMEPHRWLTGLGRRSTSIDADDA